MGNVKDFKSIGKKRLKYPAENYPSENYYELINEASKLTSLSMSGYDSVNWGMIIDKGIEIFEKEAKDLRIWRFFSIAVLIELGLQKFLETIDILDNFLSSTEGDTVYPISKSSRPRINSIAWWNEQLVILLSLREEEINSETAAGTPAESEKGNLGNEKKPKLTVIKEIKLPKEERNEVFEKLAKISNKLNSLSIDHNFGNVEELLAKKIREDTFLSSVKDKYNELKDKCSKANPQTPKQEDKPLTKENNNQFSEKQEAKKARVETNKSEMNETQLLKEANKYLMEYYSRGEKNNKVDNALLSVNQSIARLNLDFVPDFANSDKITQLPAPEAQERKRLKKLKDQKKWQDLVSDSSRLMREYKYWLDLDYYIYVGLKGLGKEREADAQLFRSLSFIEIVGSEIISYKFNNGNELAAIFTRTWLKDSMTKEAAGEVERLSEARMTKGEKQEESFREKGENLVKKNRLPEAVNMVKEALIKAGCKREKVLLLQEVSHFYEMNAEKSTAAELLYNSYILMKKSTLAEWDKNLYTEIIKKLLDFKSSLKDEIDIDTTELQEELRQLEPLESIIRR